MHKSELLFDPVLGFMKVIENLKNGKGLKDLASSGPDADSTDPTLRWAAMVPLPVVKFLLSPPDGTFKLASVTNLRKIL